MIINAVDEDKANAAYRKECRDEGVTKPETKIAIEAAKENPKDHFRTDQLLKEE